MVKILSLNIDGLPSSRSQDFQWSTRKIKVSRFIEETKPDIIGFQEASVVNVNDVISNMDFGYKYYLGAASLNDGVLSYNPILWSSSYEVIKEGSVFLSKNLIDSDCIWDAETSRTLTWVLLKNNNQKQRCIIVNTHLDNKGVCSRLHSTKIIINYVKQLVTLFCCDAIVIGDFNSRAWYPSGENQSEYDSCIIPGCLPTDCIISEFTEAGFIDSYLYCGYKNSLSMNTYHDYKGNKFPDVALRIDWQLLYRYEYSKLQIISYEMYKNDILSDHYPIICDYQLYTTTEDALYFGKNQVFGMCEYGYALRSIADYVRKSVGDSIEVRNRILSDDVYSLIDKFTKTNRKTYDMPTSNALIQNGIVKYYNGLVHRYIIKKNNPLKNDAINKEISNYRILQKLFPDDVYLGSINNQDVYFRIAKPIKIVSGQFLIMKSCPGIPMDKLIYDNVNFRVELLTMLVRVFDIMLDKMFVCLDLSPRNTIVEETQGRILLHLIDFEKSYPVHSLVDNEMRKRLYRGQFFGEELAVVLPHNSISKITEGRCNPNEWIYKPIALKSPFRPEIDQILKGRGYSEYSISDYNTVEIQTWEAISANYQGLFYSCRFPARTKFKIEHYLGCLGFCEPSEYERKITEILIKMKATVLFDKTVCLLSFGVGLLEEMLLVSYIIYGTILTDSNRSYALLLMDYIDNMYNQSNMSDCDQFIDSIFQKLINLRYKEKYD